MNQDNFNNRNLVDDVRSRQLSNMCKFSNDRGALVSNGLSNLNSNSTTNIMNRSLEIKQRLKYGTYVKSNFMNWYNKNK